jgi:hypothetical protein
VFIPRPLDSCNDIRRIDLLVVDIFRWFWKKPVAMRHHLWLWWRYTLREPYIDPGQANDALRQLCGYKVQPSSQGTLKCWLPGMFRFKFGVLVFFVPIHQRSRHWTLCWVRWLDDPLELYLVRSAARGVSKAGLEPTAVSEAVRKNEPRSQPPSSGLGFFDSISSVELEGLLGT